VLHELDESSEVESGRVWGESSLREYRGTQCVQKCYRLSSR
jgi:hypothetical protein